MSLNWVPMTAYSAVPMDAVVAGHDVDGSTIYVGRAYHEGDLIPAKVIPSKNIAYVPHGGQEVPKHEYHILCGSGFTWVPQSGSGYVPPEAVCGGNQTDGENLYVGRAQVGGSLMTGKIHPTHNCIYVPFDGMEHSIHQYEVLVASRRSSWVPSSVHSPLPEGAVHAGHDIDGSQIYVGRAWHGGDQIPAKVIPSKRSAYVAYGGQEVFVDNYDVLCGGSTVWVTVHPSSRAVPPFSVAGGQTSDGEPLYIGRAHHNGSLTVGKVHISHGCLYIPFDGQEVGIHSQIEVLTEP